MPEVDVCRGRSLSLKELTNIRHSPVVLWQRQRGEIDAMVGVWRTEATAGSRASQMRAGALPRAAELEVSQQ